MTTAPGLEKRRGANPERRASSVLPVGIGGASMVNKARWEEIMSVAAKLFCEKGFLATTMDEIAVELDITKPALYYYINTKHDLLYAICEVAINELVDGVRKINGEPDDPEEKLQKLIKWHVTMFSRNGDMLNVYLADEGELPPEKRVHVRSLSREYESIYREIIGRAVSEGLFRELDVPIVVRAISGMCNWLSAWYKPDGQLSADEIADIFYDLILRGCRLNGRRAKPGTGAGKPGPVARKSSAKGGH
jgi:AcrR family transcriptional regulator